MSLVEEFLERYEREFDFYRQAARLVEDTLDTALSANGVRAIVTSRAKNASSLQRKLATRNDRVSYCDIESIYKDVVDLAGVRVALYFPGDRAEVDKLIKERFDLVEPEKKFPTKAEPAYEKRFSGYAATHYRVQLKADKVPESDRRYCGARIEIQVASVLMHAWAEVEHDLVYKPSKGGLSKAEYAILDELNGLVLAGEIALEQLQEAGKARLNLEKSEFLNHFDLAAFLYERSKSLFDANSLEITMGRVDELYELLKELKLNSPTAIEPMLKELKREQMVANQLIDAIIKGSSDRYEKYRAIKSQLSKRDPRFPATSGAYTSKRRNVIKQYLDDWIQIEQLMLELRAHDIVVNEEGLLQEIKSLQNFRNKILHGELIPDQSSLDESIQTASDCLQKLKQLRDQNE